MLEAIQHELELNDLNIHLYLTLTMERLQNSWTLTLWCFYNVLWLSWGLIKTQNSMHTISDLDRFRLTDTRSAGNASIGADTDSEYRIDASLL